MQCAKCGSDVQNNSKFCPSCGAPVNQAPQAPTPPKKGSVMKTVGKVIGGIVLLAMIGSCMSGNKDTDSSKPSAAPTKVVAQLNAEQVKFLESIGITETKVIKENKNSKTFTSKGDQYKLYTNDKNGVTKVSKVIGEKEWYVWTDDHGKWTVPANDGKYIIINIDEMNAELKANAARASKNYKGVDVKFTGWLDNIDSDGDYVTVRGQDRYAIFNRFHCRLKDKKHKEAVINKDTGSKITIKGRITDVGEIMGYTVRVDDLQ